MKVDFKFLKLDASDDLQDYTLSRLEKLAKFEWKPLRAHVSFTAERHDCCVEIRIHSKGLDLKASSRSADYSKSVDAVIAKLQKQFEKKKHQIQNHLVHENTHEGKLELVEQRLRSNQKAS